MQNLENKELQEPIAISILPIGGFHSLQKIHANPSMKPFMSLQCTFMNEGCVTVTALEKVLPSTQSHMTRQLRAAGEFFSQKFQAKNHLFLFGICFNFQIERRLREYHFYFLPTGKDWSRLNEQESFQCRENVGML